MTATRVSEEGRSSSSEGVSAAGSSGGEASATATETAIPIAIIARIFFSKRIGEVTLHTGSSVFANNGYMGIPLALAAFGDGAMTVPMGQGNGIADIAAIVAGAEHID